MSEYLHSSPLLLEAAAYFGMAACALLLAFRRTPAREGLGSGETLGSSPSECALLYRLAAAFAATTGLAAAALAFLS